MSRKCFGLVWPRPKGMAPFSLSIRRFWMRCDMIFRKLQSRLGRPLPFLEDALADGAFEPSAGDGIIVQGHALRRAGLGQRGSPVEHLELRAGALLGPRSGHAEWLLGLFLVVL